MKSAIRQVLVTHGYSIVLAIVLITSRALLLLLPPLLTSYLIDVVLPHQNQSLLIGVALCIFLIPVVSGSLYMWDLRVCSFVLAVAVSARTHIYSAIQQRALSWFHSMKMNDILQRYLDETEKVTLFFYQGIGNVIWLSVTIILGMAYIFYQSYGMAFGLLLLMICQLFILTKITARYQRHYQKVVESQAILGDSIREMITGIEVVKSMHHFSVLQQRDQAKVTAYMQTYKQTLQIKYRAMLLRVFFSSLSVAFLYYYGGSLVMVQALTVGQLVAVVAIFLWITPALTAYQQLLIDMKEIKLLLKRIQALYNPPLAATLARHTKARITPIRVQNLAVIDDDGKTLLRDINYEFEAHKSYAIIGESGTGKSTFAHCLLGLLIPSQGTVLYNGEPYEHLQQDYVKKLLYGVSQNIQLQSGSIYDNLRYANDQSSLQEIEESLAVVALHDWMQSLPNGLDTDIGELGSKISGGELQRIEIARAVLRRPAVLILDEATSALDYRTEHQVLRNLREKLPNTTIIIITHRVNHLIEVDGVLSLCKETTQ
ncbi:ABC transporter ATP-binding protein [Fictibacillus macauensis ZFHKF-1]|uniref:ABC transporter ATP-binding protein n=1 Tax=Fictibacillus macauensis ZFHKF-1 TaxID=1196324 RepID=I8AF54_9BACL|nr:ABC transporter ATP-binding protein [Fictibacillus macauensis]EIT84262.1 ABC transporter ATP-binding protein [Fictibacillus macauensis ZFHKF-1]